MVRRDKNIPWEVIIRKFKCEISEKEQAELDVWLADVENHARFQVGNPFGCPSWKKTCGMFPMSMPYGKGWRSV